MAIMINSLEVETGEQKSIPQLKLDDVKSWIWLQKAIHPELGYDLCFRKKWLSRKLTPWNGISIKKWIKEMKQKRKEEGRLQKAEVHAAVSVAGVAAALAAIAVEATDSNALKQVAVASAAALVAAQCAQVAEAIGAKSGQINSAISTAIAATDASSIITLTAAAATSLRGAATLRERAGHKERINGSELTLLYDDFDFTKCRGSLAKGDEILVGSPNGNYKLRWVSVQNKEGRVLLKLKKFGFSPFCSSSESIIFGLDSNPYEEQNEENENSLSIQITTNKGKIKLCFDELAKKKKWMMSINHMLTVSAILCKS